MKKFSLFYCTVILNLFIKYTSAQSHVLPTQPVHATLTKSVTGIITWDSLKCIDIIPWKNVFTKTMMKRVFNFRIQVSTVKKDNSSGSLSPNGLFPGVVIQTHNTFSIGNANNNIHFSISNIPLSTTQIFLTINALPGLNPSRNETFTFIPQVINVHTKQNIIIKPNIITMECQSIPK